MILYPLDPILGGSLEDTIRRDILFGGSGPDVFVLKRDGKTDTVMDFDDQVDQIDLSAFDVTFDSVMIQQISTLEFKFVIRGETTKVTFAPPQPGDPPIDLSVDDFIFPVGIPDPPVQVQVDTEGETVMKGTSLPDVFILDVDYSRDVIRRFELGKDIVDLSAFNTSYAALEIIDRKPGRVVVKIDNDDGKEVLVLHDFDKSFTAADLSEDVFLF